MPGRKERTRVVADRPLRPSEATSVIGKSADRPVASATGRGGGLCEYCFTYTSGRCHGGCISVANICPDCSEQGRRCPFCRDAGFGNEARREERAADWWTSKPEEEDEEEEEEDQEEEDGLLSGDGKRGKKKKNKKKKRKGEAADDAADSRGGRRRGCCCKCILVLLALAAGAALGLYKFAPDVWDEVRAEVLKRSPVAVQQMLDGQPSSEGSADLGPDDSPKAEEEGQEEGEEEAKEKQDADEDEGERPRPGANETKAAAKPSQADVQRLRAKLESATAGLQGAEGAAKEPAKEPASEGEAEEGGAGAEKADKSQAPVAATRSAEQDSFLSSSWSGPGR